ncbi:Uncharacterized membrane protein HdeD, DUF308 family [Paracoccus aminovorans]|uniref:Uncharacterized membrane protein HdeD, DUF308 family n=1 Tax=Paracoccus aminovorans TaxID=34004 RepID=A0A1I2ZLJ5_9RHOB|nr:DUF308 domain-containing protein [Paracoccus aminovorans]CQR85103.1 hypothetical protein JCM7685_0519 [Paracoccus aminovorans]SFH38698.1 Uncharacterized membrane protein HdeD, DUF308 family [Paracoccus aminovorans]
MDNLVRTMSDNWWVLLLRGIAAVAFGLIALAMPGLTLLVLLITFGVYAVFDGILAIVTGFRRKAQDEQWWAWALDGLLSVLIGLMALFWPAATAVAFVLWMAAWAIVAGIFRIIAAIRLRREIEGEWALGLSGLLLALWGILLVLLPAAGLLGFAWMIGTLAVLIGIVLIVLAFRLRGLKTA